MIERCIAIETRQLSHAFSRRTVLRDVNLQVAEGESIAITGGNGAGKTTLLRCLASVVRPTHGEVRWFGQPAIGSPYARRLIGLLAHESGLYPYLTLRENLLFAARMCGIAQPAERVGELLQSTGLRPHANRLPPELSKGMRQRLALARALVHQPAILLLDEPFAGLDADGAQWLLGLLNDMRRRGRTLCFAIHDEAAMLRLADRILQIRSGGLEELDLHHGAVPATPVAVTRAA